MGRGSWESSARKRAEAVRRRVRAAVVSVSVTLVFMAAVGVLGLLLSMLPDHVSTEVVGGEAPRRGRASAGSRSSCPAARPR
ncbi:hypothetical protein OG205_06150 [Lentzea sp. NBC_00516]|uniref:hypothetical protein n=1 Tax=Lentzea sp. NBC_00516 TaxID=2903582 RepID=UPI002E803417|nr:hypothetical protein [Lentzea sp. NBC_00516]WUD26574.1 hypothetical protein OG205_06150 [Lentzea sp. NBC_00516]